MITLISPTFYHSPPNFLNLTLTNDTPCQRGAKKEKALASSGAAVAEAPSPAPANFAGSPTPMASREPLPDDLGNATEPEEETTALQRKRTRRVSFADITSVHVFDRDEDFETPPDPKPGILVADCGMPVDSSGDSVDTGDSDDSKDWSRRDEREEDGDEEEDEQGLFVRNLELLSPGSAAGSATSNEGTPLANFF